MAGIAMKLIELATIIAALAGVLAFLFQAELRLGSGVPAGALGGLAALLIVVQLASGPFRWQMLPAHVFVAFLLLMLLVRAHPGIALQLVGAGASLVASLLAVALTAGMPVRRLPSPDGPFPVGVITAQTTRAIETDGRSGPPPPRRLIVKVWYPADIGADADAYPLETLWSEFYEGEDFPAAAHFFLGYLRGVPTRSHRGAPIRPSAAPYPVLVYNHGLVSIAAENTLLMEALASQGYVVASVRHADQQAEYAAIQRGVSDEEKAKDRALYARLRQSVSREERARLSLELYANSSGLPVIVSRRRDDTAHVVSQLDALLGAIPGYGQAARADASRLGVLGLSLGGAVATEFCNTDPHCRAAVNMDGGLYGAHALEPARAPYLMLSSEANAGGADRLKELSGDRFEEEMAAGAKHLDFHDAHVVLPILRWFGVLGRRPAADVNRFKNARIRVFFDAHLQTEA